MSGGQEPQTLAAHRLHQRAQTESGRPAGEVAHLARGLGGALCFVNLFERRRWSGGGGGGGQQRQQPATAAAASSQQPATAASRWAAASSQPAETAAGRARHGSRQRQGRSKEQGAEHKDRQDPRSPIQRPPKLFRSVRFLTTHGSERVCFSGGGGAVHPAGHARHRMGRRDGAGPAEPHQGGDEHGAGRRKRGGRGSAWRDGADRGRVRLPDRRHTGGVPGSGGGRADGGALPAGVSSQQLFCPPPFAAFSRC